MAYKDEPKLHAHLIADVAGLQDALDAAGGGGGGPHTHPISDVTGLQAALDGKQAAGSYASSTHNHDAAYAAISHGHAIADVTGLQTALDGKQASLGFTPVPNTRTVAGKALSSDVTLVKGDVGLGNVDNTSDAAKPVSTATQTALNAKQNTSEKGVANGYASLGADGKVPSAQLPASQGGADPWTVITLGSDFVTSSATAVDVTGMAFTPAANTRYMFEATLMTRTATATVGPRPGIAWATGMTDGVVSIQQTSAAATNVFANGNISAAVLAPVGGVPTTTGSWPAFIWGNIVAGASPSGTVKVQLASETAGTNVTIKAGSFLRYRTY